MPHEKGIMFIDRAPVIAVDATGVTLTAGSGPHTYSVRYDRATWRKALECAVRQLNEFEQAERMDRGRVIPMERRG